MCAHACQRIGNSVFFADAIEYLQADGVFFDAALLKFSLHHFSNVDQLFSCVSRRLLRGGRVAIVTMREEDVHHFCLADFFPSMQMAMMGIARQLPVAVASMERSGIKLLEETDCIIAEERWDDSLLNRIRARYISFLNVVPDDELEAGILRIAEEIRQRTLTGRVFIQGVTLYGSR
jgi:SAM-dependent methyltransferase